MSILAKDVVRYPLEQVGVSSPSGSAYIAHGQVSLLMNIVGLRPYGQT